MTITLLQGDCRTVLATLPEKSVQCCVTSPPYFGLRRYDVAGVQIGTEQTPAAYVAALVDVFRAVRRVLREDGVLWLSLGDSYASTSTYNAPRSMHSENGWKQSGHGPNAGTPAGLKPKDLIGVPWRVAFALQDDGWILRSDIIWHKPNPMPESVTDRPTRAHEYLFLFAKRTKYYYDAAAIAEPVQQASLDRINQSTFDQQTGGPKDYGTNGTNPNRSMRQTLENFAKNGHATRNRRTVWTIATRPYAGAHFATFPEALIAPCILAGSRPNDTVLDPFVGSGTTCRVAERYGRDSIGIDLGYEDLQMERTDNIQREMPL